MGKTTITTETSRNTVTTKSKEKNTSNTHTVSISVLRSQSRSLSVNSVIRIVVLVLLFLSVFSILIGHHCIFGVQTLLNTISDMPTFDITEITKFVRIPDIIGDWGIFDGLRGFLNTTIGILNSSVSFLCFVGEGFVHLIQFVSHIFSNL